MSQLSLLKRRGFAALFWTQFLGAFNDNLFKNALVILIAYKSLSLFGLSAADLVVLSGGIFILPFFLFSASAGQLADKLPKPPLVRWVKAWEIGVMVLAAVGFLTDRLVLLLAVLFLLGMQSSFFGPVKYSILPQLLPDDDLVGGNALVESGTFLAILLGTIAGGVVIAMGDAGTILISIMGIAIAGWIASCFLPPLPAENPGLAVAWNPLPPMRETYALTRQNRTVYLSVLGMSWFWFFGAAVLALLPSYTKDVLGADEHVITLFLALFCTGIGAGSLLCERLSDRKLELGLVPFGSIGMTVFAVDLFLVGDAGRAALRGGELIGIGELLSSWSGFRIAADLTLLAGFGGMFIVPLNTLIQQRSEPSQRSRVVAGSNIVSALFMVISSLMLLALFAAGLDIPQIFLVLALLNAVAAAYIYKIIPEFLFRFVAWILAHVLYRLRVVGREYIPLDGPVLLVSNHVSFIDWLIIASACKRPPRFVMDHGFLTLPLVGWIFRDAKVIPIAPAKEDAEAMEAAFDRIAAELEAGEVVCLFPEGRITHNGKLNGFRPGVEKIVRRTPVPVVPMALKGLWGSFFSRKDGAAMRRPFRRFWSRIELVIGRPVAPAEVTAEDLARRVAELGGLAPPESIAAPRADDSGRPDPPVN